MKKETWRTDAKRYALALLFVSMSFVASLMLRQGTDRPFLTFVFAGVLASAWFAGPGPGWFAVVVATFLVDVFYIPPIYTFSGNIEDIPWFLSFIACAVFGNVVSARQQRANAALMQARDNLEAAVAERTAALERANEGLKAEIAERARAEAALREARIELERITRLRTMGELTASIAHEINQPLAAIAVNASTSLRWLAAEALNLEEARAAVARIVRDARRAGEIIANIRSLLTRAKPERTLTNLNEVVHEVLSLMRADLATHNIVVTVDLAHTLPTVMADRIELQQLLLNLIMNAKEAMTQAVRRLLVIRTKLHADGSVTAEVVDSGAGFDPATGEHLFEAFFSTKPGGMGMGLSICRSIVEYHGGRIWAETSPGGGAIFRFTIPVTAGPARVVAAAVA